MKHLVLSILLLIEMHSFVVFCQTRQTNTTGSDLAADVPFRMKKLDANNQISSVPLHFYVHSSGCFGCNNELTDIKVWLKNADETSFNNLLTFDTYSVQAFDSLLICRSTEDIAWGMQAFDSSGYEKNSQSTIRFTSDQNIFGTHYVDITKDYWYFTLTIPAEKLNGLDDIFDIKVNFSLNMESDQQQYFRVFRQTEDIPRIQGWYRGDMHNHTMFSQNDVEYGLPLGATKVASQKIGLDWITVTDHSSDYDNYGLTMQNNWDRLGAAVQSLNTADSSFIFIRAMEASINNSNDKVVHCLLYPSPADPFCYHYFLDGGGDISSTSFSVVQALANLSVYDGFAYEAHPFAENDELSFAIGGGLWNVGDTLFPANDSAFPTFGTVSCNDLSLASDVYSEDSLFLFQKGLAGAEIWNNRTSISTTDDENNPWNVEYSSSVTPFVPMDSMDTRHHYYRFIQGLDVTDFLQQRSLKIKNSFPTVKNWKHFIGAGSDAHGSFNYSNTEMTYGILGTINDNANGKISTLAYCPEGMGHHGRNILKALKNGHTILSDGPIINLGISTDGADSTNEIFIGQDTVLTPQQLINSRLVVDSYITPEFGNLTQITLTGITEDSIFTLELPLVAHQVFDLQSVLGNLFGYIPDNHYFMIRASLRATKNYGILSTLYRRPYNRFFSITNPIWIKTSMLTSADDNTIPEEIIIKPNPVYDRFLVNLPGNKNYYVKIFDMNGRLLLEEPYSNAGVDVRKLPSGLYLATFINDKNIFRKKIIVSH
ncbi:MAG TPA: T9SS type A sorting domain-containing protein [Bacteroidales bacterium]|nr:T9SS type A sorting domain-containing protein [Bacteroidales bacterium]